MHWLWLGLYQAFVMFWETFWALVLGFTISAALQVFVSKERMTRAFGTTNFRSMALATLFGAASSSCSYAAVAAGRSAFQKGAALVPALAFMFASTNLVAELGALIWVLLGWQFVLAEIIGALVLIGLMWLFAARFLSPKLERQAREHAIASVEHHGGCCAHDEENAAESAGRWQRLADAFVTDWRMLWKELVIGFVIAGFLAALVPSEWWKALFVEQGNSAFRLIENAAVGPLIAAASFICSCANIPLASVLWTNGISFGGVISFIYADLLAVPLIIIYVKYYGARAAAFIVAIFYCSIVCAGVIVDLAFNALKIAPIERHPAGAMAHHTVCWNYTTWLDLAAVAVVAAFSYLHFRKKRLPLPG